MQWTVDQEKLLLDLVKENKSLEDISEALRRSEDAIRMKLRRMGLPAPEKSLDKISAKKEVKTQPTTTTPKPIKPAEEVISMKEMMLVMLGALEKLKQPKELSNLELKRLRLIVSIARTYMRMLEKYQEWTYFEQKLVDSEAWMIEILESQLLTAQPKEKAKLKQAIHEHEESLKEIKEKYGYEPRKKKTKLVGGFKE